MSTFDNVKTYVDEYLKQYKPYKEEELYQLLMDYITDNYLKELYENTPEKVINYLDKQQIDTDLYDKILIELGFPESVIQNASTYTKELLIRSLSDFTRYKGSIKFLNKLATAFNENFSIAELYIDRDNESNEWVLRPRIVYKGVSTREMPTVPYRIAYETVPSLLISPEELEQLYQDNALVLPIKSNLLMFYSDQSVHISIIKALIFCTFMKYQGNEQIPLYFSDHFTNATLADTVRLWYYLLLRYYNVSTSALDHQILATILSTQSDCPTLEELDNIVSEFNQIKSAVDAQRFYDHYLAKYIRTTGPNPSTTADQLRNILKQNNEELANYIEDRLSRTTVEIETPQILNELFVSISLFGANNPNPTINKYISDFLETLPMIQIDIKKSSMTYKILYHLKPYHVEVVEKTLPQRLIADDPMQTASPIDEEQLFLKMYLVSVLTIGETITSLIRLNTTSPISIIMSMLIKLYVSVLDSYKVDDIYKIVTDLTDISIETIGESFNHLVKENKSAPISILSYFETVVKSIRQLTAEDVDDEAYSITTDYDISITPSNDTNSFSNKLITSISTAVLSILRNLIRRFNIDNQNLPDNFKQLLHKPSVQQIYAISETNLESRIFYYIGNIILLSIYSSFYKHNETSTIDYLMRMHFLSTLKQLSVSSLSDLSDKHTKTIQLFASDNISVSDEYTTS